MSTATREWLRELDELHRSGRLTDEEFATARATALVAPPTAEIVVGTAADEPPSPEAAAVPADDTTQPSVTLTDEQFLEGLPTCMFCVCCCVAGGVILGTGYAAYEATLTDLSYLLFGMAGVLFVGSIIICCTATKKHAGRLDEVSGNPPLKLGVSNAISNRLDELDELHRSGRLTDEEFASARATALVAPPTAEIVVGTAADAPPSPEAAAVPVDDTTQPSVTHPQSQRELLRWQVTLFVIVSLACASALFFITAGNIGRAGERKTRATKSSSSDPNAGFIAMCLLIAGAFSVIILGVYVIMGCCSLCPKSKEEDVVAESTSS